MYTLGILPDKLLIYFSRSTQTLYFVQPSLIKAARSPVEYCAFLKYLSTMVLVFSIGLFQIFPIYLTDAIFCTFCAHERTARNNLSLFSSVSFEYLSDWLQVASHLPTHLFLYIACV